MAEIADRWLSYAEGVGLKCLNVGCGKDHKKNCYGVDIRIEVFPDIVADIERTLPIASGSVDFIWCDQVLEHVRDIIGCMNELHRVLKSGGVMWVGVPRFPEPEAVMDPTHVRFFVSQTFDYFCSNSSKFDYGIQTWKMLEQRNESWGVITVLGKE